MAVAFLDATNTTRKRRQSILDRARKEEGVQVVFVESICNDQRILNRNYRMKLSNADYKGQVPDRTLAQCRGRGRCPPNSLMCPLLTDSGSAKVSGGFSRPREEV